MLCSQGTRETVPREKMNEHRPLPARTRSVQQGLRDAGLMVAVRELPESTRTAAEAAAAIGCEIGAIASSLVFIADDEPLLVMTSGRHRVDTDLLAKALGVGRIDMATAKQVRSMTGQAIGGVAPLGHPEPLPTLIDEALRDYETIWAAAGTPHTIMPLTFSELVALTNGTVRQVSRD
jgi:prolyl-tRNA editing enzyme YbaK/EbsC (Cys-tRNA(Pro) deacylase)